VHTSRGDGCSKEKEEVQAEQPDCRRSKSPLDLSRRLLLARRRTLDSSALLALPHGRPLVEGHPDQPEIYYPHAQRCGIEQLPVRALSRGRHRGRHKGSNQTAAHIHGMDKPEPSMGALDSGNKVVRMGILVRLAQRGNEERHREQREWRGPSA
jgi:hypothetical protein